MLVELSEDVRAQLIREMDAEELAAATEGMEVDDLADLLSDLPETVTQQLLHNMDQQDRERLTRVLSWPEDTAGGLMSTDTVSVRSDVSLEVCSVTCACAANCRRAPTGCSSWIAATASWAR